MNRVRRHRILAAVLAAPVAWILAAAAAHAQGTPLDAPPAAPRRIEKAHLRLAADRSSYAPGAAARIAGVVEIEAGWHVQAHKPTYDYLIPTVLSLELPTGWSAASFDYPAPTKYKFAFAEEQLDVYEGSIRLVASIAIPRDAPAGSAPIRATLRYQACDDKECLPPVDARAELALAIGGAGGATNAELFAGTATSRLAAAGASPAPRAPAPPGGAVALLGMLGLALVGGLVLNGMPCVLPILSLKVFALVKSAGESRREVSKGALATTAGILVSFWALAAVAIGAKSAGSAVGWGIQFQEPGFVAFLAVVVLLFSLNLWGLFEILLPARLTTLADQGQNREGLAGHFATGLFATLMATPCSAPFLGTALSFALGQSGAIIFAIFTFVGLGLALPYLILAAVPGAARIFPKPGAWMETLKGVMGFLLAGAVIWLLYVLSGEVAPEALALFEVALLALALTVWLARRRRAFSAVALVVAVLAVVVAARAPRAEEHLSAADSARRIAWIPFDRAAAERLSTQEGKLVFLDITADWCVTCKVNERITLDSNAVVEAFRRLGVVAMKADWTNRNDEIARFLAEHGRYGIPFYMLYRPGREPLVFSELPSRDGVLRALEEGAKP